jgi:HEAT repeat protein
MFAGVLATSILLLVRQQADEQANPELASVTESTSPTEAQGYSNKRLPYSSARQSSSNDTVAVPATGEPVATLSTPPNSEAYIQQRVDELIGLGAEKDPASLDKLLNALTNPEPQIRAAALEALVQFGSRDAVPRLEEISLQTQDAHERAEIAEAIEFLKLPSLSEVVELKREQDSGARLLETR